jgi:hypothetical protein
MKVGTATSRSTLTRHATPLVSLLVHLLGFRCMLKRILIELDHGLGAMFTPDAEVLAPFNDCVGFIAQLSETELDGYFLNCERSVFVAHHYFALR